MKTLAWIFIVLFFTACQPKSVPSTEKTFADSFKVPPFTDTLVFAAKEWGSAGETLPTLGDTISYELFKANVTDSLRTKIEAILNAAEPIILAAGRFPLDDQYDGLAVDISASWFRNQSLLIFDKQTTKVVDLVPISEFYGGDGGQILRKSWFIQTDGKKQLFVRDSQHTLNVQTDEPTHSYENWVSLYQWQSNTFATMPIADSAALIRQFPVVWNME